MNSVKYAATWLGKPSFFNKNLEKCFDHISSNNHSAVRGLYTDNIHNAMLFIEISTIFDTTKLILFGDNC